MAKQKESALSLNIRRALNARGHRIWKNWGSRYSERGLADLTGVAKDGRGVVLEVKLPGKENTLRPDQLRFLKSVPPLAIVGVVTSVQQAIAYCESGLRWP